MAHQAECVWLISEYFHEQFQLAPELLQSIAPNGLKAAFSNASDHRKMLKELESYQFPIPEFKPWNSWQKTAKRKMTPGLLVMSIGSRERLNLEEIIKRAKHPLILTGHGIRLRIDHGALLVQDGFTHYPQHRNEFRFFPGDWRTPS